MRRSVRLVPILLIASCADARPGRGSPEAAASTSCPVVEVPSFPPRPEHRTDWLVQVGERLVIRHHTSLGAWPIQDGAKASVTWDDDVYPGWGWVLDGQGSMVNVATGRGLVWKGGLKEGALPEGARFDVDGVIGRSRDGVALVDSAAREVRFFGADRASFRWSVNEDRAEAAARAPDGGAWIGADEWVARFDADGNEVMRVRAAPITVEEIAVSPDGASVAVMAYEGMVNLLDAETGVARWAVSADRGSMDFSPDGTRLLLAHYEGAEVVDAETGCLVQVLPSWGHVIWLDDQRVAWLDAEIRLRIEEVRR